MFNVGQRIAVRGVFRLAGYEGTLMVAPVTSDDERVFVLEAAAFADLKDRSTLEQAVGQILGRKVAIVEQGSPWFQATPFE